MTNYNYDNEGTEYEVLLLEIQKIYQILLMENLTAILVGS